MCCSFVIVSAVTRKRHHAKVWKPNKAESKDQPQNAGNQTAPWRGRKSSQMIHSPARPLSVAAKHKLKNAFLLFEGTTIRMRNFEATPFSSCKFNYNKDSLEVCDKGVLSGVNLQTTKNKIINAMADTTGESKEQCVYCSALCVQLEYNKSVWQIGGWKCVQLVIVASRSE